MRVAIIGAGVAGLACASDLAAAGHDPVVFEKARGPGGRLSTRRTQAGAFDHGCPTLARGAWLLEFAGTGVTFADFAGHEVPVPTMSTLCRALAADLDVRPGVRIAGLARQPSGAIAPLADDGTDLGTFDAAAVTAPAPQAAELLHAAAPELASLAGSVAYAPCWAAMAAWPERLPITFDFRHEAAPGAPLQWAARESAKPGREPGERWTLQAGPGWTAGRLEDDADAVARDLVAALGVVAEAGALPAPAFLTAHRWRYARALEPLHEPCLVSEDRRLGAAGDWCAAAPQDGEPTALQHGAGVADALHSGRSLALGLAL